MLAKECKNTQFQADSISISPKISIISLRNSGENNVKAFSNIRTPTVKIKPNAQILKYSTRVKLLFD